MTLMDDIIKWFKAPKTIKGIAGMIVIIILLAVDFAYWAGAIEVTPYTPGSGGGGDQDGIENYTIEKEVPLDQQDTITAPGFGQPIPETYRDYPFTIEENATEAIINVTLLDSLNGVFLPPDLDLYVYGPGGDEIGMSATQGGDESVTLSNRTLEREGPGEYVATVKSYRGIQVTYQVTAEVFYMVPFEAEEGE